ncbi:MAG: DNA-processing protein DprA [Bdellovibrionales bacterium]
MYRELKEQEKVDWLQLIRSENVGPVTFRRLLEFYGNPAEALRMLPELAQKGGAKKPIKIADRGVVEKEFAAARKMGVEIVCLPEACYPRLLRHIDDAPPLLMCRGHTALLEKPALGIVGTRNASLNARKLTDRLTADLGEAGFVIVSGLARGIDGCAHQTALNTGTIGVLGGGVDVIYPEESTKLYEEMIERGLVISEAPLGYTPQTHDFPRRNRIISGLSLGVLVVEAALKSGSLITARMALEQNREVFAVPGSPLDPRAAGTNNLIREGAGMVESAADILRVLRPQLPSLAENDNISGFASPENSSFDSDIGTARNAITDLLSPTPNAVDDVIRTSGYSPALVLTVLLELELAGRLARQPGGKVALIA